MYQVLCRDFGGGWQDFGGVNGPGWMLPDEGPDEGEGVGVATLWDEVPETTRAVRVDHLGETFEIEAHGGYFLFCRWDVPEFSAEVLPRLLPWDPWPRPELANPRGPGLPIFSGSEKASRRSLGSNKERYGADLEVPSSFAA